MYFAYRFLVMISPSLTNVPVSKSAHVLASMAAMREKYIPFGAKSSAHTGSSVKK